MSGPGPFNYLGKRDLDQLNLGWFDWGWEVFLIRHLPMLRARRPRDKPAESFDFPNRPFKALVSLIFLMASVILM